MPICGCSPSIDHRLQRCYRQFLGRHQGNRNSALPSLVGGVVRPANCPRVAHTRSWYLRQDYPRGGGGDPARGLTTFVFHRHWARFVRFEGQFARLIAAWLQDNCLIGLVHNAKIIGERVPATAKGQPEHDKKRGSPHRRQLSSAPYPHHMVSVGRCSDPRRGTSGSAAERLADPPSGALATRRAMIEETKDILG